MSLHNFNSNTKSWKMYTNTLTSISGDDLLVMPSYGKDLILEVSANNDIFFKKGEITKRFDNLVSDYLETSFNSLNSQIQYILQEISGNSVKDFITSGISNDLLIKSYDGRDIILEVSGNNEIIFKRGDISYNLDDLIGGGGGGGSSQNSDYATYNILDITGKIIFTDNSNVERNYDASFNNVHVNGSLNVAGTISASNIYTKSQVDDSFSNVYTKSQVDASLANIYTKSQVDASLANIYTRSQVDASLANIYTKSQVDASLVNVYTKLSVIDSSLVNVYTRGQVDVSFVSKQLFDASLSSIQLSNVYTKSQVDASFVSRQLFEASYNDLAASSGGGSGGYIQNNENISFDILNITDTIIFTDSSNVELYNDASFNNVDVSGSLNVAGTISASSFIGDGSLLTGIQEMTLLNYRDASFSNIEVSGNIQTTHIKSLNSQDLLLEVSGNNEIIFKRGDISYNLDDLIGGGSSQNSDYALYNILDITSEIIFTDNSNAQQNNNSSSSNIVLTSVSGDIIPSINNTFKLGDISKNWSNAYIRDISVTNIELSGNIVPLNANSSSVGTSLKPWGNAYILDISVSSIDVSGSLKVAGSISASNIYTKSQVDVSFVSKQLFDASLSSIQLTNVYTKTEVDVSFVSKQLFDASINALATSSGGGSSTSIYDTNIKILPDWTPIVEISNSLYNNLGFGSNLSFSKDGSTVASFVDYRTPGVTGNAAMVGRIIVYHYNGSSWVQKGQNLDGTDTHFGNGQRSTLSSDGNMIAIGFPYVRYIYNENGNWVRGGVRIYKYNLTTLLWEQMGSFLIPRVSTIEYGTVESELFGNSMSFSTDGTIIAIGAPYAIWYNGAVFIYKYETRNSVLDWYYSAMLFAIKFQIDINIFGGYQEGPDIWPNSNLGYQSFGELVALSSDGTVVAATAPYAPANDFPDIRIEPPAAGIVRIFKFNGSSWINTGRIVGEYENDGVSSISISLSGNGNIIAIGTHRNSGNGQENGHVRVYAWNNSDNSWNQLGLDIDGQGGLNSEGLYARTGNSISLSYDGTILAVSSTNQGEYKLGRVYKWDGTSWNRYGNGFNPGNSIFLTSDGNKLASATTDRASIVIYNLVQNKIVSLNSTNLFCSDGYSYSYKKNDIKTTVYPTSENSVHSEYYSDFPNKFTRTLYILQNGSLYNRNNTYGSFSDIRLKENIIDATPKLQDLLKVRVVNYNLKGSTNKQIGVLAQELEEIFPGLVETESSGEKYKSVKYSCINIMLVKALQEQQVLISDMSSNINTLKDEIATLKQNMDSLLTRIQALEPNASQ